MADWISGIGSLLAVAVALYFSLQQRNDLKAERLLSVNTWIEKSEESGWKLVIHNATPQPIYRWLCTVKWPSNKPGEFVTDRVTQDQLGIVPPGQYEFSWEPEQPPHKEAGIQTTLIFADIHSQLWTRLSTGKLRKTSTNEQLLLEHPEGNK